MRWLAREYHDQGDTRTRRKFLWLPKMIGNEVRWLEWATWTETYFALGSGWDATRWEA